MQMKHYHGGLPALGFTLGDAAPHVFMTRDLRLDLHPVSSWMTASLPFLGAWARQSQRCNLRPMERAGWGWGVANLLPAT
jgi:hypothetical protein